ncbi:MAG TPA: FISUMP domain-containing protein, partial [Bacteroidales bacterium]|nr:FISUMP domain-containing protein [Bacteroidales bacterium]
LYLFPAYGQSPEKMSYQAIIRDASDSLITNTQVGMQISILQGSATGTAVYVEKQTPTTNANGLVSLEIGSGTIVSGSFASIDWANGPYFIKIETDPTGGTNYTITGTSQLLSVPYALHAKTAETVPSVPTGTTAGDMQYWNGTAWVTVAAGYEGATLQMIGGVPTWTGGTPPSVTNPTTGKIWMDRNLGASQVATSSTDAAAYGDLYQWGRGADGHQSRTSNTTTTLATSDTPGHGNFITVDSSPYDWRNPQNDNLWQGVSGTNNPCPSGYRLPTLAEWNVERASWSSNDAAGAFASPLKLTMAGRRFGTDGSLYDVGSLGGYWSSTVEISHSLGLSFNSSDAHILFDYSYRAYGYSVRCIKD